MANCVDRDHSGQDSDDPGAYNQQAISYALAGKLSAASACLRKAIRLQPDSARGHNNLGNVLHLRGSYQEAAESYRKALSLEPDSAMGYSNLGNALTFLGRYEEAVTACRQALRLEPQYAEAHNNLGNAYKGLDKLPEAMACYEKALALQVDLAEARNNLGVALAASDRLEEAVANYREARRLKPDSCQAISNLAGVFVRQANWQEAMPLLRQAVRLRPKFAPVYYNLGYGLSEQGKMREAVACFQRALRLDADHADTHWSLALALLALGDFKRGWPEYEWRWRLGRWSPEDLPKPVWDGSSLAGRTILLYGEGGFGDEIQFIRYVPIVKRYGGTVILACRKPLLPLVASFAGFDRLVSTCSRPQGFDVQAPLLSLPRILKTSLSTVPADIPYLFPDAELREKWQRRLRRYPGFKIGIAWQGNPQFRKDRQRSIPLVHFAPLAGIPGVRLLSLQKGFGTEQLGVAASSFRVIDLGSRIDKRSGAFMDTAAIMKSLDLVITSDTAIAHLAGALGVPVWLALTYVPEWRWLLKRDDSPWYPTMRLFRQTKPGDWDGVFARMADELGRRTSRDGYGAVAALE